MWCCSELGWGLVFLAQPLLPVSTSLLASSNPRRWAKRGVAASGAGAEPAVVSRWTQPGRGEEGTYGSAGLIGATQAPTVLTSCRSSVVPALQFPTSSWCWCSGQQPFLSPSAGGRQKHIYLHCCLFVMTTNNRWYRSAAASVYINGLPPVILLAICQKNKARTTTQSLKKQTSLLVSVKIICIYIQIEQLL